MFDLFRAIARKFRRKMLWSRKIAGDIAEQEHEINAAEIEVGAVGTELRYWLAKEALRQEERSFSSEAAALAAVSSQATTVLGWIVTAVTAAAVLAFNLPPRHPEWRIGSACICVGLTISGILCIIIIFPRKGTQVSGFNAPQLMQSGLGSELEHLESLALGLFAATENNRRKVLFFQRVLGWAWITFLATPILSVLLMEASKYHFGFSAGDKN